MGVIRPLTGSIRDIAETIGVDIAAALVAHFGGTRLYVPAAPKPHHGIVKHLAPEQVARLVSTYGGQEIDVPMHLHDEAKARRGLIVKLRRERLSVRAIARQAKCTERHVWQVLADARAEAGAEARAGGKAADTPEDPPADRADTPSLFQFPSD